MMHPQGQPPPQPVYMTPPPKSSNTLLIVILAVIGGFFVIGILAAVAIPQFLHMQKKSKKSEAELNLLAIQKALKARFAHNAGFVVGSSGETPATSCCDSGRRDRKCEPDLALWEGNPVWDELLFDVTTPHDFRYEYQGTAESFTARAIGDLDCDLDEIEYVLTGEVVNGNPVFTLTKPVQTD
jgi:type II secretory pathway pseudopilin PulG